MRNLTMLSVLGFVLVASGVRADQPHMERALDHLKGAEAALERAKANKGGHREKALDHIGKAKEAIRSGMAAAASGDGDGAGSHDGNMKAECKGAAAGRYGTKPVYVTVGRVSPARDGFSIEGSVNQGNEGTKQFNCIFGKNRKLKEVMALTADRE